MLYYYRYRPMDTLRYTCAYSTWLFGFRFSYQYIYYFCSACIYSAYRKALSEGELNVSYSRIMLLGSAGVGKSSLKRGLMNLPFDPKINSTIIADVQSLRPSLQHDIPSLRPHIPLLQPTVSSLQHDIPLYRPDISLLQHDIPSLQPHISLRPGVSSLPPHIPLQPCVSSLPPCIPSLPPHIPLQLGVSSLPPRIPLQHDIPSLQPHIPLQPGVSSLPPYISLQPGVSSLPPRIPLQPGVSSLPPHIPLQAAVSSLPPHISLQPGVSSLPPHIPLQPGVSIPLQPGVSSLPPYIPSLPPHIPLQPGVSSLLPRIPLQPGVSSLPCAPHIPLQHGVSSLPPHIPLQPGVSSLPPDMSLLQHDIPSLSQHDIPSVRPHIPLLQSDVSSLPPQIPSLQPTVPFHIPLQPAVSSLPPRVLQPSLSSLRPVTLEWAMAGDECTREWREVTPEDEIEEIAQLISIVHKQGYDTSLTTKAATSLFPQVNSYMYISADPHVNTIVEQIIESEILSPAMERASMMSDYEIEHIKPQPFFHVWDCGGQPVFLEVLPAFLTSRTMFLLLFDASIDFNTRLKAIQYQQGRMIEEGEVNMTTLELMEGWMANIHGHLAKYDDKGGLFEYPRIIAVGTRADKLKTKKSEVRAKLIKCLQDTSDDQKYKKFLQIFKGIVIVDNTTFGKGEEEDEGYKYLRKEIFDFTNKKLVVRTPIKWVLFRKVLQSLMKKSINIITLREASAIGVACNIMVEDMPSVLKFYHELGVVLFYSQIKGLQEKVILNPKWFVDCLGKVLTLQGREGFEERDMWALLREKGILVEPLYVAVWKECEGVDPEEFIQVLVSFHLAAKVQTDEFGQIILNQFFVPAVLPTGDISSALPSDYTIRASPLHIIFGTGYVIPGFFTRLVTSMAESAQCHLYFRQGIFRNRVTFEFGDIPINRVTLTELSNAIQVNLLRYIPDSPALTPIQKSCQDLQVSHYV